MLLIDYGSVVWGTTSSSNHDRISKLQKLAARIILHADFNTPSAEMFKELIWLPIVKRLNYNKAVFTYKAMNNLIPQYTTDLLKPVAETHNRSLRCWSMVLFQGLALHCLIGHIRIQLPNCGILFQFTIHHL